MNDDDGTDGMIFQFKS